MSREIPEGWRSVRIGEVAKTYAGGTPSRAKQEYFGGSIPWLKSGEIRVGRITAVEESITDLGLKESSARMAKAGTPVIAMYGSTAGVAGLLAIDAAISQAVLAVSPNPEVLDPEFCYRLLQFHSPRLLTLTQGTFQPNLSKRLIDGLQAPIPSVTEQRRIAEILSSMDEAVQATQAVIKQTREVKQGVLKRLMTKGVGHSRFKKTEIGEIPEEWKVRRIDQLGEVQSGRQRSPHFTEGEVRPYLRVANVFDGLIDTSDLLSMRFTDKEFERFKLEPGDILLNEGQSIELVGRNAVYEGQPENCCFQNTLIRFRSRSDINPRFAYALMQHLYMEGRFSQIAAQTTSVAHLGGKRFASLVVGVPPLPEQNCIAEVHDSMIANEQNQEDELAALINFKSALALDLLTGRKRVSDNLLIAAE